MFGVRDDDFDDGDDTGIIVSGVRCNGGNSSLSGLCDSGFAFKFDAVCDDNGGARDGCGNGEFGVCDWWVKIAKVSIVTSINMMIMATPINCGTIRLEFDTILYTTGWIYHR